MYGAYNEANAKLVTAEGDYPSNYEHYSGFETRSQKKRTGILKGIILHGRVLLLDQQSLISFTTFGLKRHLINAIKTG